MRELDLKRILDGDVVHIDRLEAMGESYITDLEVTLLPIHVKNILLSYLNNKITADELVKWAGFICIHPEYVCKDWENDESTDFYETMFDVVQSVSVPEINYEITPENVRRYLKELDKYFKGNA